MNTAFSRVMLSVLLGSSSVALAGGAVDEPARRTVHFADLDLARAVDATVLYGRIHNAAGEVCARLAGRDLKSLALAHSCVEQAVARAVADVNAPVLTSYYLQKAQPRVLIARR